MTRNAVADRSLVLDANILIRAVLGKRVGQLIEQYVGDVDLLPQIRRLLRPKSTCRSSAPKEDYRWIRQWRCTTAWVRSWKSCRSPCTANRKRRHAHASNAGTRTIGR